MNLETLLERSGKHLRIGFVSSSISITIDRYKCNQFKFDSEYKKSIDNAIKLCKEIMDGCEIARNITNTDITFQFDVFNAIKIYNCVFRAFYFVDDMMNTSKLEKKTKEVLKVLEMIETSKEKSLDELEKVINFFTILTENSISQIDILLCS